MKKIILKSPYFSIVLLAAIFIAVAAYSLWIPKTVNGLDLLGAIFLFMMAFKAIQMCSDQREKPFSA